MAAAAFLPAAAAAKDLFNSSSFQRFCGSDRTLDMSGRSAEEDCFGFADVMVTSGGLGADASFAALDLLAAARTSAILLLNVSGMAVPDPDSLKSWLLLL